MNRELISQIDESIEKIRPQLAKTTIELVNIRSAEDQPADGAPFGEGVRQVQDLVLRMGEEEGFFPRDYGVGVVSIALKEGTPDLGIWTHGDVVPEGEGWLNDPYDAKEYQGYIIGRGATDNKGQLAAIFHLFRIFRDLGIELKYIPALFVGGNEETGMKDMTGVEGSPQAKGYLNVCTPPRLSLVPDGGFPVGYGGKGGLNVKLRSRAALHGYTLLAGQADAPGKAEAIFDACRITDTLRSCSIVKGGKSVISTYSAPRHGTNPDPEGNMITSLTEILLSERLVAEEDRPVLRFLKSLSLDVRGSMLGIATESETMSPLTVFAKAVECIDGCPEITLNIRYPIEITSSVIREKLEQKASENGFEVSSFMTGVDPYLLDPDWNVISRLCEIANEVTGEEGKPYTVSGGTYAHRLPGALVYGMSGNKIPEGYPEGRGGAHGVDEVVSLERLERAMKIYARALLALNEMEW